MNMEIVHLKTYHCALCKTPCVLSGGVSKYHLQSDYHMNRVSELKRETGDDENICIRNDYEPEIYECVLCNFTCENEHSHKLHKRESGHQHNKENLIQYMRQKRNVDGNEILYLEFQSYCDLYAKFSHVPFRFSISGLVEKMSHIIHLKRYAECVDKYQFINNV